VEQSNENIHVGADAVAVESIVLGLFSLVITVLRFDWEYFWIFYLSLVIVFLLMLHRVVAAIADDPNIGALRTSLKLSPILLQIPLLGVLLSLSQSASMYANNYSPILIFISLAVALPVSSALVDELLLGEYVDTWVDIIYQQTTDGPAGQVIRSAADFGQRQIDAFKSGEKAPSIQDDLKAIFLGIVSLALLSVVTLPVWLVLSNFIGNTGVAILLVISLLLLRDITRYVYINYGAAQSFGDLKIPLRWGFILTILKGLLVFDALGLDLATIL